MSVGIVLAAALLLAVERACYVWIARAPGAFRRWSARSAVFGRTEPVAVVRRLFYAFKGLQALVFAGWCYVLGEGTLAPASRHPATLAVAGLAIAAGQVLNWSVFYRLGAVGAFFGDRLGHEVRWCRDFPFSLMSHPQYVGTVLTIWGVFLAMRFPRGDWYVLPVLETAYYLVGAWLEDRARVASA